MAFVDKVSAALAMLPIGTLSAEAVAFVGTLRAAPPRSPTALRAMLPQIPSALAYDVARLLLDAPRSLRPSLAALLEHTQPMFAHAALRTLSDRPRATALPLLVDALRRHPDPDVRCGACHTLAFTWPRGWPAAAQRALLDALRETADDPDEDPNIRGQALEGIANRFEPPLAPADSAIVQRALDDAHPAVRFWACFAAWQTHDAACIPRLKRLAEHDTTRPPHMWPVAVEAADALGCFDDPPRHAEDHPLVPFGTWQPDLPIRRRSPPFEPAAMQGALRSSLLYLLQHPHRGEDVSEDMNERLDTVEAAGRTARVEAAPELGGPPNILGARLHTGSAEAVRAYLLTTGLEREPGSDVLRGWYANGVRECLVRVDVRDA